MKTNITVSIDNTILEKAKRLNISRSSTLEEALRYKINFKDNDIDDFDIELTRLELRKEEKKLTENQQKVSILREKVTNFDQKLLEIEQKHLENEKKFAENLVTCIICAIKKPNDKFHQTPKGPLCHACFMLMDQNEAKKWIN